MTDEQLFDEAEKHVIKEKRASPSNIQRTFRIGYNRAMRTIEELQKRGVVSAFSYDGTCSVLK